MKFPVRLLTVALSFLIVTFLLPVRTGEAQNATLRPLPIPARRCLEYGCQGQWVPA